MEYQPLEFRHLSHVTDIIFSNDFAKSIANKSIIVSICNGDCATIATVPDGVKKWHREKGIVYRVSARWIIIFNLSIIVKPFYSCPIPDGINSEFIKLKAK